MPRMRRQISPDSLVHVVNRGNDRRKLFKGAREYEHFLWLAQEAKRHHPVRMLAYVLMPNHWHFVMWPDEPSQVSRYFHRLTGAHAARTRVRSGTVGHGHVYQDRFRNIPIESDLHYFHALRYVEVNPLSARLVDRAEDWRWSSLSERLGGSRGLVDDGPFPLPERWVDIVNDRVSFTQIDDQMNELLKRRTVSARRRPVGRN